MYQPASPELDFITSKQASTKASKRHHDKAAKDKYRPRVLEPRNAKQADLIAKLKKYPVVFALGAAGAGKTFIPAAFAAQQLDAGVIEKITISRPTAAPSRHKLGFLPGTDAHKTKPWMVPIMDAFKKVLSPQKIEQLTNQKQIETLPFEHMRGRTVEGFFLLDEAQNCTVEDLELVLTRVGPDTTLAICGDVDQDKDLGELSGLAIVVKMAEDMGLNCGIVWFDENDVVRSATAAEWVKAFKKQRQTKGIGLLN